MDMNWLANKKVTKILKILCLVPVTGIYSTNPSNVELFLHTRFHGDIIFHPVL